MNDPSTVIQTKNQLLNQVILCVLVFFKHFDAVLVLQECIHPDYHELSRVRIGYHRVDKVSNHVLGAFPLESVSMQTARVYRELLRRHCIV